MNITKRLFIVLVVLSIGVYGQEDSKEDVKSLMSTYYNKGFEPFQKSNWFVSFSMSLEDENFENSEYRLENIQNGDKSSFEVDLRTGYYFSDYFAGSIGFTYGGDEFDRTVPQLIGDPISKNSKTNTYGLSPALRSSIPIVPNQRLDLYVDLTMDVDWGKTTTENDNSDGIMTDGSNADNFGFGVGIKPGITFFVMENFALEIGLEILGYNYESTKTTFSDDTPEQKYSSNTVNFDLSLSTLQLSLAYYIGVKKKKK